MHYSLKIKLYLELLRSILIDVVFLILWIMITYYLGEFIHTKFMLYNHTKVIIDNVIFIMDVLVAIIVVIIVIKESIDTLQDIFKHK